MIRGTHDNPPPLVRHPCVSYGRPSYLYHRLMVSRMPGNFVAGEDTFHEPSHRRQTYRKTRGILIEIGPLTRPRTRSRIYFERGRWKVRSSCSGEMRECTGKRTKFVNRNTIRICRIILKNFNHFGVNNL